MALGTKMQLPSAQLSNVREDLNDATQGSVLSALSETYSLADGDTLLVAIDGAAAVTATFLAVDVADIAAVTAAEAAAIISSALGSTGSASVSGSTVLISSAAFGASSSVEVTGGTAAAAFAFPAGAQSGSNASPVTRLVNRVPEPSESSVALSSSVAVDVHDTAGEAAISALTVTIDGVTAYDLTGGGFQSGFSGSVTTPDANTRRVVVQPAAPFASDATVAVAVAASGGSTVLSESYSFATLDVTLPTVASAAARDKSTVRVTFGEPVLQSSSLGVNDALNPANYALLRLSAPAVDAVAVSVVGVSATEVDLATDIELSFGASYTLVASSIVDTAGNLLAASPDDRADFVAFTPEQPAGRSFSLIDWIPQINKSEDQTGDLAAFVGVLQDVAQLLLCQVDDFAPVLDPDTAPDGFLDAMLLDLGNPFDFVDLTTADKRRLLRVLLDIYKLKGTESGIVSVVAFFLGLTVTIDVFNGEGWELADSATPTLDGTSPPSGPGAELSSDTSVAPDPASMGPSGGPLLYSFLVVSPVDLTADRRDRIVRIVELMKPAHTHLVGVVEPATAPAPVDHLELGLSVLGGGSVGTFALH